MSGTVRRRRRLLPSTAIPTRPGRAAQAGDDYGIPAEPDWRTIDWPAHLASVDVDGVPVNHVDIGPRDGPCVVFVHGLGGSWQNWLEQLPATALRYRAVALDLPGFGATPLPREPIGISAYARTVDRLCERLGLGAVAVVGNSMGGFTAAELAIRFPGRVERLVLVSAAGISTNHLHRAPLITLSRALNARTEEIVRRRRPPLRRRALHLAFATIIRHPTRIRRDLLLEISPAGGSPGHTDALKALLAYDFRDRLPEIGCPTLIVHGAADFLVPVADADEYARLIGGARKVVYADTGHLAMVERPRTFNADLLAFLAEGGPD